MTSVKKYAALAPYFTEFSKSHFHFEHSKDIAGNFMGDIKKHKKTTPGKDAKKAIRFLEVATAKPITRTDSKVEGFIRSIFTAFEKRITNFGDKASRFRELRQQFESNVATHKQLQLQLATQATQAATDMQKAIEASKKEALVETEKKRLQAEQEASPKAKQEQAKKEADAQQKVVHAVRGGIANVGNNCYMSATIQALAECPFLRAVLEKEFQSVGDSKVKAINDCRKKLLQVLDSLQSTGKNGGALSQAEVGELLKFFLDFQVKDPSYGMSQSSVAEKFDKQMDAALFIEFLVTYLGLSVTMKDIALKDAVKGISLEALIATTKYAKDLVKSDGPDLLVFCIAGRFSQNGKKKLTSVQPSSMLSETYKLCAVICNPSDMASEGHYITNVPVSKGWIEYNDASVSEIAAVNLQQQELIEQHSYIYLYAKIA